MYKFVNLLDLKLDLLYTRVLTNLSSLFAEISKLEISAKRFWETPHEFISMATMDMILVALS
jgi:hypothetical protein